MSVNTFYYVLLNLKLFGSEIGLGHFSLTGSLQYNLLSLITYSYTLYIVVLLISIQQQFLLILLLSQSIKSSVHLVKTFFSDNRTYRGSFWTIVNKFLYHWNETSLNPKWPSPISGPYCKSLKGHGKMF